MVIILNYHSLDYNAGTPRGSSGGAFAGGASHSTGGSGLPSSSGMSVLSGTGNAPCGDFSGAIFIGIGIP